MRRFIKILKRRIAFLRRKMEECKLVCSNSYLEYCQYLLHSSIALLSRFSQWPLYPPGFFRVKRSKRNRVGLVPVHSPAFADLFLFRLVVRLGTFISSDESPGTTCISGLRLLSICGVHTKPKGTRDSRYVVKSIRGWACVDVFFHGSYLSELLSTTSACRFLASLNSDICDVYFVFVDEWRTFVSNVSIPSCCSTSIVILLSRPLVHRELLSTFVRNRDTSGFIVNSFLGLNSTGDMMECIYVKAPCICKYSIAAAMKVSHVPVAISFVLSSRNTFRRFGFNITSIRGCRVGFLHDSIISSITPFISVRLLFKNIGANSIVLCNLFGVNTLNDLHSLLSSFLCSFKRFSRYVGSDLRDWSYSYLSFCDSFLVALLDQGHFLLELFGSLMASEIFRDLYYFFFILDAREFELVKLLASRGMTSLELIRKDRHYGLLLGYYARPIIMRDLNLLFDI